MVKIKIIVQLSEYLDGNNEVFETAIEEATSNQTENKVYSTHYIKTFSFNYTNSLLAVATNTIHCRTEFENQGHELSA